MRALKKFRAQVRAEIRYWRECARFDARVNHVASSNWLDHQAWFHFFRLCLGHFLGVHCTGRTCYIWKGDLL